MAIIFDINPVDIKDEFVLDWNNDDHSGLDAYIWGIKWHDVLRNCYSADFREEFDTKLQAGTNEFILLKKVKYTNKQH